MRIVLSLLALATALAATVSAHHSFSATYDTRQEIKLAGKLVSFVYRNPHSFVHLEAPDAKGVQQRWAVEWGGTAQLANAGVKRDSLKVGDEVVMTVNPSRVPGEYRVLMLTLRRPADGFQWGRRPEQVD